LLTAARTAHAWQLLQCLLQLAADAVHQLILVVPADGYHRYIWPRLQRLNLQQQTAAAATADAITVLCLQRHRL
jgi:hypothetical protein